MAIPIKQTDKTLIFDLRDFAALGEEKSYLLCVNENTYHVILGLFQFYGFWLNRYAPNRDEELWYQPEGDQAAFVGDMYDKGMEELQMPVCFDELIEAVNNGFAGLTAALAALQPAQPDYSSIVEALQDMAINVNPHITVNPTITAGCCDGSTSGGSNSVDCPPNYPQPGEPGSGSPGAGPGEGESLPEEQSERQCQMAIWLVDNYLRGLASTGDSFHLDDFLNAGRDGALGYAGRTIIATALGGLAGAIASQIGTPGPTPDDPIWVAVGVAIGLFISNSIVGRLDFDPIVSLVDDHRDELVCALASATSGLAAKSAFMAIIDNAEPALQGANRGFIDNIFPSPVINLLFYVNEKYPLLEAFLTDQNEECPCGDAPEQTGDQGEEYKCKAANVVLDTIGASTGALGSLSGYSWASFSTYLELVSGGGLTTLLTNALVGLPTAIVQYFFSSASTFFSILGDIIWLGWDFTNAFPLIQAYFAANKATLLCELLAAEDVSAAKTILDAAADAAVTSVLATHPEWAEGEAHYKLILKRIWTTAVLNVLFAEEEDPDVSAYEGDPCDCGPVTTIWYIDRVDGNGNYGTDLTYDLETGEGTATSTAELFGRHRLDITTLGCKRLLTFSISGYTAPPGNSAYWECGADDEDVTLLNDPWGEADVTGICIKGFALYSNSGPFTITWTDEECEG